MLSKSAKYTLKAVLYLATNSDKNKKIMVKEIAKSINVPQAYTAKLLQTLAKQHIISSTRGPKGGFFLNEENKKNSIMSVIDVIDGEKKMTNCLLSLEKCNEEKPCPLHAITNNSRSNLVHSFRNKSIADLVLEINSNRAFLPI